MIIVNTKKTGIPCSTTSILNKFDDNLYNQIQLEYETRPHLLIKFGKFLKLQEKRWFILHDNKLYYSTQNKICLNKIKKSNKFILLDDIEFTSITSSLKNYLYCIKLKRNKASLVFLYQKSDIENNFMIWYLNKCKINTKADKETPLLLNNVGYFDDYLTNKDKIIDYDTINLNIDKNNTMITSEVPKFNDDDHTNHNHNIVDFLKNQNLILQNEGTCHHEDFEISEVENDDNYFIHPIPKSTPHESMLFHKSEPKYVNFAQLNYPKLRRRYTGYTRIRKNRASDLEKSECCYKINNFNDEFEDGSVFHDNSGDFESNNHFFSEETKKKRDSYDLRSQIELCTPFNKSSKSKNSLLVPNSKVSVVLNQTLYSNFSSIIIGPKVAVSLPPNNIIDPNAEASDPLLFKSSTEIEIESSIHIEDNTIGKQILEDNVDTLGITQKNINLRNLQLHHKSFNDSNSYINYQKSISFCEINSKEDILLKGNEYYWNFQLIHARKCFETYAHEDAFFELLNIETYLAESCLTGKKKDIELSVHLLNDLLTKINQKIPKFKENGQYFFVQNLNKAEALLMKGLLNAGLGNKFLSFKNLAESWRLYKKIESITKNSLQTSQIKEEDIWRWDFGYAIFNLGFALIPKSLLKIIKLIGINPREDQGVLKLDFLRKTKSIRAPHAALLLCLYYLEFEFNCNNASNILNDCLRKYPKCPLVYWLGSLIAWKKCQPGQSYILIKQALLNLENTSQRATFLIYEIGWYYFITMKWSYALSVLEQVVKVVLDKKFFMNQNNEIAQIIKSLNLKHINEKALFSANLFMDSDVEQSLMLTPGDKVNIENLNYQDYCILPHKTTLLMKITVANYQLGNDIQGLKWLLSTIIISKKYSIYKNHIEEDFGKLSIKYLNRRSKFLLTFEVFYFLKLLSKMPDDTILDISTIVDKYVQNIDIDPHRFYDKKYFNSIDHDSLCDYFSGMLIITINNCLLGETLAVCSIVKNLEPVLDFMKDEYLYIHHHFLYWFARALFTEKQNDHAKKLLGKGLKMRKCEFSLASKMRKLLAKETQTF